MHYRPAHMRLLHAALLLLVLSIVGAGAPAARANWLFSYPPNQVTLDSGHRNNVFMVGDPIQFSLTIFNYGTYNSPGTVRYEVRDYWGSVAASGTVPAPVPNGPTTLSLPTITQPGWYKLYLHQSASVAPWGDSMGGTMFVIFRQNANFPAEPSENAPDNSGGSDGGDEVARGVTGMGPQRHPVGDASQPAAAIASIGPAIAQDKQYYTPFDPQRSRPLLVAFPNGVGASDPVQQGKNLAGLTQIVTQFHSDVKYWEPLNEPNYKYSPADYINKELKPFYQTVKAVDPTCKVLGPGIVTIGPGGLSWIEGFLQAGGAKYIDAFSFHAYNNVNGDLTLARESLGGLNALLTKYGVGGIEKWQTEQGYFAACYGAYQPRLQGRWTMLQMMVYEQYGIPKEHNHLWYDKSHGFWDFPAFWENEDGLYSYGSFDPAAPLMRVWSEELYGTNFQSAYNLGALGNNLYVGSLFGGPGKQVAAFQSSGSTDGSLTLSVTGGSSLHVVSAFGVASDLPVTAGQAVLPVPEIPVYVELAPGQTIQPVPVDYGANLALTPGTVATTSGNGQSPLNASYPNDIGKVINGTLENWYYNQGNGDHPWMGNDASLPGWVQITLPRPMIISHAVVYAGVPWQNDGSLLDYELQYDQNGSWVTLSHPVEPTNVVDFFTSTVFCTADSFYSDRDVFVHDFAPVTTQKIRLLVHNTTYGGAPTQDIVTAGGQPGPHQITLREIELYGPFGQPAPITSGPLKIGFLGDSITYGIGDGGGPGCCDRALTDLAKNGYQATGVNYGSNGASVSSFYQQTAGPLQAFEAAGVSVVSLMLGTNDAQTSIATSPKDYHDKLLGIINSLLAPGTGIQKVILHYSPYIQPNHSSASWDAAADARLQTFQAQIDSLCNGTTILQGDKTAYPFFQQHPEQGDGVHPTPQGHQDLGDLWAIAITNALGGTNTLPYPGGTAPPAPAPGTGTGLLGQYFNGVDLTTLVQTRVDPVINFNWNYASPLPGLGANDFSIRWTGQIQPLYSETYTFSTVSDDGVRLWVNGEELVNDWTDHGAFTDTGSITLTAGQKYDIKMEYYQRTGGTAAQLSWSSPSQAMQVVPQSQLYPAAAPAPSPVLTSITVSPGSAALNSGATQQFTAVANDQNGNPLSPQPAFTWSALSGVGTVSASGLYSAGTTPGSATVQAASGSVHGAATVTVTAPAPTPGTGTVSFFPRPTCANRMQGGQFQGSTDGVTYTTLYTISGMPADGQWTSVPLSVDPKTYRYLRYVSPNGGWGNVSEIAFYSGTGSSAVKLTGTSFGTPGSYANSGNTFDKAFDGNTGTYFDGPGPNGNYTGIDQGGAPAPTPSPTPTLTPVYQISAGGPGTGTFAADKFVQGGWTYSVSNAIDTSGDANPAQQGVYRSERFGNFTYTLPNLTPGGTYTLRLHFAEIAFGPGLIGGGGAGSRIFNVAVNGQPALSNFDVFLAAGGADKAIEETFTTTADGNGNVTVAFTSVKDNPKLSGLELLH